MNKAMKTIITFLAIIGIIYSVASYKSEPSPVDECYQFIWGDSLRMESLGLEGLNAREVYDFCREAIIKSDTIAQEDSVEPRQFIMGEPIIETVDPQLEPIDVIEPTLTLPDGTILHYTHDTLKTP